MPISERAMQPGGHGLSGDFSNVIGFLKRLLKAKELPDRLSYDQARAVLESNKGQLEQELAARADAEPEMLYYLAERGTPASRRHVAANPATPAAANRILAEDIDPDVRAELAQKIGRLLPDLLVPERERVCELTLETLRRLASDQLVRVRKILAAEIKSYPCVPKDVVVMLAGDVEETVSVPILEYSPLLSDADLLEVITSARAQSVLAAVARRRGVSERVSELIVASLDTSAVAALLANPDAVIRESTMDRIIDHAQSMAAWQQPLVKRSDLSLRALRRIAGFVGVSLLRQLSERHELDEETVQYFKRCLRLRLERDDETAETKEDKAHAAVLAVRDRGALDERYVEEAVEAGQRDTVIESLALLANTTRPAVEKIFSSRSAKAITALAWKAGLTMRIAFKIQSMMVRLHADELLPARAGVAFPLGEDEMRWHLSYFQIPGD
jgi:uncharacterized protein (DUF2336 family)